MVTITAGCRKYQETWYIDVGLVLAGVTQGIGENATDDYGSIGVRIKYDPEVQYVRVEAAMGGSPGGKCGAESRRHHPID